MQERANQELKEQQLELEKLKKIQFLQEQKEKIENDMNSNIFENEMKIKEKQLLALNEKIKEEKRIADILAEKEKKQKMLYNQDELTKFTIINQEAEIKNDGKNKRLDDEALILKKIEDKILKEALIKKREEEIKKRKFSYFIDNEEDPEETDKTKYFFDENNIVKTLGNKQNDSEKFEEKKKLIKKNLSKNGEDTNSDKKNKDLLAALSAPRSIVELKEQKIDEKKEVLYFDNVDTELGIKQKKKLKEFAKAIKDRPVKVIIRTSVSKEDDEFNKFKKILKSRSLYIRSFLLNQGISHNRITIQIKEKNISKNWKNEVILTFIEV